LSGAHARRHEAAFLGRHTESVRQRFAIAHVGRANADCALDEAVFAAYGWPASLTDDEPLAKLLELNLAQSATTSAE
jgi:hypothetical protein